MELFDIISDTITISYYALLFSLFQIVKYSGFSYNIVKPLLDKINNEIKHSCQLYYTIRPDDEDDL